MWPNFASMLTWWQWVILAAVPVAIIALYFLKLKRQPLEVPSTYLWHKSIEDLHVNSVWQRLRRNLLLFLQLLLLLLVMLALLRPSWQQRQLSGDRFIFLVDNSASMQATDVEPSRLEEAKRRVVELIDEMKSGDVAMVVSFADAARVEQTFTDDRRRLRRAAQAIQPTPRSTSLLEALKVASGLANPGAITEEDSEYQVAEALPAELFILSDGRFTSVAGFSLGNLKPVFVPVGESSAANVGIVAFSVRRKEAKPDELEAFARLENFGTEDVTVEVDLFLNNLPDPIDADELRMAAGEAGGVVFDLGSIDSGVLKLQVATLSAAATDDLAIDDVAWTVVSPPRRANVLLLTPGNEPLELALTTDSTVEIADVVVQSPEFLKSKSYAEKASGGAYDLVIYDRCAPKEMPRANTLFIGRLPPQEGWSGKEKVDVPQLMPVSTPHPLMQWIDLRDVVLAEGTPLEVPPGGSVLIDSDVGPMLAVAPRESFEDAVLGFVILDEVADADGKLQRYIGTNWMTRQSFPVFVLNVFDYLGGSRGSLASGSVQPGKPVTLKSPTPQARLRVRSPGGETTDLRGDKSGKCSFTGTAELGVYDVRSGGRTLRRFAVNLFDVAESDIRPDPQQVIKIGYVEVEGQPGWEAARRDIWKGLLLLGLAVLALEWYIYNRRVYL